MRRTFVAAVFVLPLLAALPARAGDDVPGCENAGSNVEMGACTQRAYEKADAELNAVWPKVLKAIAEADYVPAAERKAWKERVVAAQRAWVTFKENDCAALAYEWWGGSGASIAETACLYARTAERVADLGDRYLGR